MKNLIALSPILLMLFLAVLITAVIFFIAKRSSRSEKITEYERRIQALEEENRRLKETQRHQ
ncbi:hypothetical protein [Metaplanococcus flavidus]|uniref:Uncharacterized protein n=1 Tax=Metaplanococcus flavidus TaxID=569883 RepID=A0ABW3LEX0_9BACL